MPEMTTEELFEKGMEAVNRGDTLFGIFCFEKLVEVADDPAINSYLAVCLAKEREDFDRAIVLCHEAMEVDPGNAVHYMNLGRVYLAAGLKKEAIKAFRNGLLHGRNELISQELNRIGWRDVPVIPQLDRRHPVNKVLGKILYRLGFRRP